MSSIAPLASQEIGKACMEKGVKMLDAPVSGWEPKAVDGTLSIMAGSEKEVFDAMYDTFMVMGGELLSYAGSWEQVIRRSWLIRS